MNLVMRHNHELIYYNKTLTLRFLLYIYFNNILLLNLARTWRFKNARMVNTIDLWALSLIHTFSSQPSRRIINCLTSEETCNDGETRPKIFTWFVVIGLTNKSFYDVKLYIVQTCFSFFTSKNLIFVID